MTYQVHFKEKLYLTIKLIVSLLVYGAIGALMFSINKKDIAAFIPILFYVGAFLTYFFISHGLLIGYLRGNAVRVSESQFPEVFTLAKTQSEKLGIPKVPSIYIMQAGGLLNAFATRFLGKDFVVIYSDILETAYEQGNKALEFIVAHELGHIKRKHCTKQLLLFPSFIIPFLNSAYSRACEYTCDRIGHSLCPEGSTSGMLILAAGKRLHSKIDVDDFILSSQKEKGFWKWFAEILSSHPNLPKRVAQFKIKQSAG